MSAKAQPFTTDALERLFAPLSDATRIVAAVSGGPDSMALMHLLARWAASGRRPEIAVATIDHGMRAEAPAETALVAGEARRLGFPYAILTWTGPKPVAGVQEAAREARYRLLADHARALGASHLVTAHTRDDQAETLLMRLSRGSGLAGLSGMRPATERSGIRHLRPLLSVPKSVLVDLCRDEDWPFVEDPSNADERFARSRWRRIMPVLAAEGLDAERLALLAERAARVEEALDAKAHEALGRATLHQEGSAISVQGAVLLAEPFEIALRALILALAPVRGGEHLRLHRAETCLERLCTALSARRPLRATLAGALLKLDRDGRLHIAPEPSRRRGRCPDNRMNAAGAPRSLGKRGAHA